MLNRTGKTDASWENFSNNKVSEFNWNGNFRVSRKSFFELCTKLHPHLHNKQNRLRNPMPVEILAIIKRVSY